MALMGMGEFHDTFSYSTIALLRKELKIAVLIPSGRGSWQSDNIFYMKIFRTYCTYFLACHFLFC